MACVSIVILVDCEQRSDDDELVLYFCGIESEERRDKVAIERGVHSHD